MLQEVATPRRGRPTEAERVARLEKLAIRRFVPDMTDDWLLMRLDKRWPGSTEHTWRGRIAQFTGSNDHLFICHDTAVMLMARVSELMAGAPLIMEMFAWSRLSRPSKEGNGAWIMPRRSPEEVALIDLYRHAVTWRNDMGSVRMVVGLCSDMAATFLRDAMIGRYLLEVGAQ